MKCLKFRFLRFMIDSKSDPLTEFSEDDQIQYNGCCQQRVFAGVVNSDGAFATHGDLGAIFVHGSFAVTHVGNVFDDNLMEQLYVKLDRQEIAFHIRILFNTF